MKTIGIIVASLCLASAAMAQDTPACPAQATTKNLHGAALNSFAKSCCTKAADAQKLHGAAKTSNVKKCMSDSGAI